MHDAMIKLYMIAKRLRNTEFRTTLFLPVSTKPTILFVVISMCLLLVGCTDQEQPKSIEEVSIKKVLPLPSGELESPRPASSSGLILEHGDEVLEVTFDAPAKPEYLDLQAPPDRWVESLSPNGAWLAHTPYKNQRVVYVQNLETGQSTRVALTTKKWQVQWLNWTDDSMNLVLLVNRKTYGNRRKLSVERRDDFRMITVDLKNGTVGEPLLRTTYTNTDGTDYFDWTPYSFDHFPYSFHQGSSWLSFKYRGLVRVVELQSGREAKVDLGGGFQWPHTYPISPDGKRIAYYKDQQIFISDLNDESAAKPIMDVPEPDEMLIRMMWSGDGIVVTRYHRPPNHKDWTVYASLVSDIDSKTPTVIEKELKSVGESFSFAHLLSPDRDYMVVGIRPVIARTDEPSLIVYSAAKQEFIELGLGKHVDGRDSYFNVLGWLGP